MKKNNKKERDENFSYIKEEEEIKIRISGEKKKWAPKLRKFVQKNLSVAYVELIGDFIKKSPEILNEVSLLTLKIEKVQEDPQNTIKNIAEIPQVIKKTEMIAVHLQKDINGKKQDVILMGEKHVATKEELAASNRIISFFDYIGIEGVDVRGFIEGRVFFWFMEKIVNPIMNILIYWGKRPAKNKSSIDIAGNYRYGYRSNKKVFPLEKGWKPPVRLRIFNIAFPIYLIYLAINLTLVSVDIAVEYSIWDSLLYLGLMVIVYHAVDKLPVVKDIAKFIFGDILLGYIFGLGLSRDRNMTNNIVKILSKDNDIEKFLILTGKAHTKKITKILVKEYGFVESNFQ